MKILSVADVSIQQVIGGAERMLFEQSVRLAGKGHEIHILTRRPPAAEAETFATRHLTEYRYGVNARNAITFLLSTLRNSRRLFESILSEHQYDCIHIHQPFSAAGVLRSPHARRIPMIYSNYSLSFEEFVSRNPKPNDPARLAVYNLNRLMRRWLEKWVMKYCRTIVVLSEFSRERLFAAHGIPSGKTTLIPGGVNTEKFKPALDKMAIRRRLQLPTDRVVLFTVRNLVARMGLENLLLAIKDASKSVPNLFLVLAGEGPLNGKLRDMAIRENIADKIHFTGFVSEEKLPSYYQMADLFVLPTKELEGFGLVTLESLSSGVPVIGTPVGGTNEILGRLDPGFIFEDTTPSSMAKLIIDCYHKMIKAPGEWEDIGARCRRFVERNYSWEVSVKALENLFARICKN